MRVLLPIFFSFILFQGLFAQSAQSVEVSAEADNYYLLVDGQKFFINGMNWDYVPIGTNTLNAEFWQKSDDLIKAGLASEMELLRNMKVNVIRQYIGVPARWIKYIYEQYGIFTILNHSFGRYGIEIDGNWEEITDYSDKQAQHILLKEVESLAHEYKNTPGLLMYLLGNENNYGLFWEGAETEDFPNKKLKIEYIAEHRGRPMYALMNQASILIKSIDSSHPVAICNGDLFLIDLIAEECTDVDIYGTNTYRGASFGDLFQVAKDKLDMPIMFTEFGADAFNSITLKEDQEAQAYYLVANWKEIYENAGGLSKAGNAIGGCTFQFSDGWWKFGFDDRVNEAVHDNNASWTNGGYSKDFIRGKNNMNEEWFGICAKGPTDTRGLYKLHPRAAYYALADVHQLNPYAVGTNPESINQHFSKIKIKDATLKADENKAATTKGSGKYEFDLTKGVRWDRIFGLTKVKGNYSEV